MQEKVVCQIIVLSDYSTVGRTLMLCYGWPLKSRTTPGYVKRQVRTFNRDGAEGKYTPEYVNRQVRTEASFPRLVNHTILYTCINMGPY